jgi:uncharacterized protein YqeY
MSATDLKQRLRADLKAAMQARNTDEIRLLRALIAALDNAEAVPDQSRRGMEGQRAFGDASGEVPRRKLDQAAVDALLAAEVADRLEAAADFERHGRQSDAGRLREEAALVSRYLKR